MNQDNSRVSFRYTSKMTIRNEEEEEPHEHLETDDLRKNLYIEKEHDHMVFWRKLRRRLRDIISSEENENNMKKQIPRKKHVAKQQEVVDPSELRQCQRMFLRHMTLGVMSL